MWLYLVSQMDGSAVAQSVSEINTLRKITLVSDKPEKLRKLSATRFHGHSGFSNQTTDRFFALASESKNEFQLLFSGFFLFYKFFISSQDLVSCSFSPSCSEFGILAVKKQGILSGAINTFDRLMRCHGFTPEKYEIDMVTGLQKDLP